MNTDRFNNHDKCQQGEACTGPGCRKHRPARHETWHAQAETATKTATKEATK